MKFKNFMEQKCIHEPQRMTANSKTGVKLPKFMLKKFTGNLQNGKRFKKHTKQ